MVKILLSLTVFLIQIGAYAQEQVVQGTITSADEGPLAGVNVVVKGTTTGTITDINGLYRLDLPADVENPVLVVSYIGFETQEIEIGARSEIDVPLIVDATRLAEVVVVGYGSMRKKDLTGSISQVQGEAISGISASSTAATLQGRAAGVNVESDGGRPGAEAQIVVRGPGSFTDATPLYVIDGMLFNTMRFVNVNDIESVEVLKDASAAAIYGSRAANGVIIITTKRGSPGAMKVDIDIKGGVQQVANTLKLANARGWCDVSNAIDDFDGTTRALNCDTNFNPNLDVDWQDEWLRDAGIYQANLGISGGDENLVYRFSAGFLDQLGVVQSSGYERLNLGLTSTYKKDKFTFSESLYFTREWIDENDAFRFNGTIQPPIVPFTPDPGSRQEAEGGWVSANLQDHGWDQYANRFGLEQLQDNDVTNDLFNGTISGEYEFIEGLRYKLNLGVALLHSHSVNYVPTFYMGPGPGAENVTADLEESRNNFTSLLVEHTLGYSKIFGNHRLNVLAGYTWQNDKARSIRARVSDFPSNEIRVLSAGAVEELIEGLETESGLVSILGRVNYSYLSKYLLTATVRRDGSSRFREDLRWGTFPSASVGWVVSEEDFFNVSAISNVKLRASYGEIGAQNIDDYAISQTLNIGLPALFGPGQGGRNTGFGTTELVFDNLVWETSKTTDIGLDMDFLDGRILLTADYFIKKSEDVLVQVPVPGSSGVAASPPFRNAADIENKGFEFDATYRKAEGDFRFDIGFTFTSLTNEVTGLGENVNPIIGDAITPRADQFTITQEGDPLGAFFGFRTDGLFQSQTEVDASAQPNARPGDQRYVDVDGNGMLDTDDRVVIGSPIPDLTYGIPFNASYMNFDLSLFFYGVSGVDLYAGHRYYQEIYGLGWSNAALNAWTPSNTNTEVPVLSVNLNDNGQPSDYFIESGAFFRLNLAQLGYTLPSSVVEKIRLRNLRVYFSGQNLFTITDYSGYSPEVGSQGARDFFEAGQNLINRGIDVLQHPTPRMLMLGLQIGI